MSISLVLLVLNETPKELNYQITNYIKNKAQNTRYLFDEGLANYFTRFSNNSKVIQELVLENEELKKQLLTTGELQLKNQYLTNKLNEINQLVKFVENKTTQQIATTHIIANSIGSINNALNVGIGKNQNIDNNQLVVTNNGIIGYTYGVKKNSAKILSILDDNFKLSAVTEKSKINVVISGNNTTNPYIISYSEGKIIEGEILYTSGLEGNFPKFIAIGKVIKQYQNNDVVWKVELFETLEQLEYVYIIK